MKKLLPVLCFSVFLINTNSLTAQWVPIPSNFASYISQYVSAAAINGSLLDTTNSTILTTVDMTIDDYLVTDITGIQYFKGLLNLVVYPQLASFPQLPAGLYSFESDESIASSFSAPLPANLGALKLYYASIPSVPTLPSTLVTLILNNCTAITTTPTLPGGLTWLVVSYCPAVTGLPVLPTGLLHLDLGYSPGISPLPALPSGLTYLNLSKTIYGPIASIQPSLDTLICSYCTHITSLPNLPASLVYLDADHCNITSTGTVPNTMLDYILTANLIDTIMYLPDTVLEFLRLDSLPNITTVNADSIFIGFGISMNDCPQITRYNPGLPSFIQNVHNALYYLFDPISISANNDNISYFGQFNAFFDSLDLSYNPISDMAFQNYVDSAHAEACTYCSPIANNATVNFSNCQLGYIDQNFFYGLSYSNSVVANLDVDGNNFGSVFYVPQVNNQLLMNSCQITDFQSNVSINAGYLDLTNNPSLACLPFLFSVQTLLTSGDAVNCIPDIPNGGFYSDMGLTVCQAGNSNGCPLSPEAGGIVFNDTNQNGQLDNGETALPGFEVEMEPGNFFHVSDGTGHYLFQCQPNVNFTINGLPTLPYRTVTTPAYGEDFTTFAIDTFHNIGVYTQPNVNDMEIFIYSFEQPRPGFHQDYFVTGWNVGTTVENGNIVMYFDPSLSYQSSQPAGTVTGNKITWPVNSLTVASQFTAYVDFIVPVPVTLGTPISCGVYALCNTPDTTPYNNHDTITGIAYGSYDPNNKSVSPSGPLAVEQIAAGNYLNYTVRFQNTGTGPATNITVLDTMSYGLDLSTFQYITGSATGDWSIDNGVLSVTFNNINLPDSAANEPGSHGFFAYRVKAQAGIPPGQQVQNSASIYFDFNAPVGTNTTSTNIITFFTQQPQSQVLCPGEPLQLTVGVDSEVVSLQWYKNGQATGITGDTIKVASPTVANDGDYYVLVLAKDGQHYKSETAGVNIASAGAPASFSMYPGDTVRNCGINVNTTQFEVYNINSPIANPVFYWYLNDSLIASGTGALLQTSYNYKTGDRIACYIQTNGCQNPATVAGDSTVFIIYPDDTLQFSVTPAVVHVCSGEDVTLYPHVQNPQVSPYYEWEEGNYFSGGGDSMTLTAVTSNTTVVAFMYNSSNCPVVTTLNNINLANDTVQIIVDSTGTPPAGTLNINYNSLFCPDAASNFIATGTNLGVSPSYTWFENDTIIGTSITANMTGYNLQNGEVMKCEVSRNICGVTDTLISNQLVLGPDTAFNFGLSIDVQNPGSCSDSSELYPGITNSLYAGGTYIFSWYLNGTFVGNSYSYEFNGYFRTARSANGVADTVMVSTSTGIPCDAVVTGTVILPVQGSGNGQMQIQGYSINDTVCLGTSLGFGVSSNDTIVWFKNGVPVDTAVNVYYIINHDSTDFSIYAVSLASACFGRQSSDTVHIHFIPSISSPYVAITPNGPVYCANALPVFSAQTNVPGASYIWSINGNQYYYGLTFDPNNYGYTPDEELSVRLDGGICLNALNTAISDSLQFNVISETPLATLDSNFAILCGSNQGQTFTVQTVYGGNYPAYQWYLNDTAVGGNSPSFTDAQMVPGDVVFCKVTSNNPCAVPATVVSDSLILYHASPVTPSVNIGPPPAAFCSGTQANFTATAVNAGNSPVYQWQVNGSNTGPDAGDLSTTTLADNDVVRCVLTSSLACVTTPTTTSNADTVTVYPLPAIPVITMQGNTFTSSVAASYQWYLNNSAIAGATGQSLVSSANGNYYVVVTDAQGCSSQSAGINITGISPAGNLLPQAQLYPNPNNGNFMLVINDDAVYDVEISDMLGRTVIASTKVSRKQEFELGGAAPGIYIVSILQNQQALQRVRFSLVR